MMIYLVFGIKFKFAEKFVMIEKFAYFDDNQISSPNLFHVIPNSLASTSGPKNV